MVKKIDQHFLLFLSIFLLFFIPLFPKIPLFDALPGYAVRIRLEDFLIAFAGTVWLREVFLGRVKIARDFLVFTLLFAAAGLSTLILAIFLLQSIPPEPLHIGKSALHYFRYLEYFSLFFFLSSAVKKSEHIKYALAAMSAALLGVVVYGLGQKFWRFPVFSTMNREFSKGELLYLQGGARPQSTFAGHYDLGAYLVIVLPLLFSYALSLLNRHMSAKRIVAFFVIQGIHLGGVLMLAISGAKTSILAYAAAIFVIIVLNILRLPKRGQKIFAGIAALFLVVAVGVSLWIVVPPTTREKYLSQLPFFAQKSVDVPRDFQGLPQDGSVWSENALKYGLSMGIRLDTLWPQALLGFANNPLLGNGFGTLGMLGTGRFVEADSTDNNFLRTLGETGLVGFIIFYGAVWWIISFSLRAVKGDDWQARGLSIGMLAATIGLLINAVYIDVFAASKVALVFWGTAGLVYRSSRLNAQGMNDVLFFKSVQRLFYKHWPMIVVLLVAFFFLHQNPFAEYSLSKNLSDFQQSLENLAAARCLNNIGKLVVCRNSGFVISDHFSAYAVFLAPFVKYFHIPAGHYFFNSILVVASLLISYLLLNRRKVPQLKQLVMLMFGVFFFAAARFSQLPLNEPLFLAVMAFPLIALVDKSKMTRGRFILVTALLLILLVRSDIISEFQQRFSHQQPLASQEALRVADSFLSTQSEKKLYFATALNPLFVDVFGHGQYSLLPLDPGQRERQGENLWEGNDLTDLDELYRRLLEEGKAIYLSDFQGESSRLNELRQKFDLTYVRLGCAESCNILQLQPEVEEISPDPVNFIGASQSLSKLSRPYSFSVVPSRFDGALIPPGKTFNTVFFASSVVESGHLQSDFLILSGDYLSGADAGQELYFRQAVEPVAHGPILYNAGNFDHLPAKLRQQTYQSFFLNSEYFIILDSHSSGISDEQKIRLYNSMLELEELPHIKNIFVIAHDLNWQNTTEQGTAFKVVESELARFPQLKKYYFTANHDPRRAESPSWFRTKDDTNTESYYFAGLVNGSARDVSFLVSVTDEGDVQVTTKH